MVSLRPCLAAVGLLLPLTACGVDAVQPGPSQPPLQQGQSALGKEDSGDRDFELSLCPSPRPPAIAPAADQQLEVKLHAVGVQIYDCKASGTGFSWGFRAPSADLFLFGFKVGTHFAGPTWQFLDGSTVVGAKLAAASPDPTAIPWLLLNAVSHGPVNGLFTPVTSLQRLSTVGGLAPATGCDASSVGAVAQVPYQADYFFYRLATSSNVLQCR